MLPIQGRPVSNRAQRCRWRIGRLLRPLGASPGAATTSALELFLTGVAVVRCLPWVCSWHASHALLRPGPAMGVLVAFARRPGLTRIGATAIIRAHPDFLLGLFANLKRIENPLGGWLWLASMVLLVLTLAGAPSLATRFKGLLDDSWGRLLQPWGFRALRSRSTHMHWWLCTGGLNKRGTLNIFRLICGDEARRGMDALGVVRGNTDSMFRNRCGGMCPNLYFYAPGHCVCLAPTWSTTVCPL